MPWNETDRAKYAVIRQRYASDLSDEEFALVQPLLPAPKPCGRKPTDPRAILNALFYLVRAGLFVTGLVHAVPGFPARTQDRPGLQDSGMISSQALSSTLAISGGGGMPAGCVGSERDQ